MSVPEKYGGEKFKTLLWYMPGVAEENNISQKAIFRIFDFLREEHNLQRSYLNSYVCDF
jgi:hypothetical protein